MNFSKSRVLSTLLLCALAVAFSGVAEAQRCGIAVSANHVRAEGLTEVVGDITLRCRQPLEGEATDIFEGDGVPETFKVAVEVNTRITNEINDDRIVTVTVFPDMVDDAYTEAGISLTGGALTSAGALDNNADGNPTTPLDAVAYGDGELSEDGTMIEWTFARDDDTETTGDGEDEGVNLSTGEGGFNLVISGLRINAAHVGAGNDVMVNVLIGGEAINEAPAKLADVSAGLEAVIVAKSGTQCADGAVSNTRVTVKEGFTAGFMDGDSFMLTFTGVPEGVTVTVPNMIDRVADDDDTTADEFAETFILTRTMGRTSGADEDGVVDLNTAGAGSVRYVISMTEAVEADDTVDPVIVAMDAMSTLAVGGASKLEWQHIYPTFEWDGGDVDLGTVMVWVNFYPASSDGGDTFKVGGSDVPRFLDDDAADTLLTINDCMTTLFYPFVTSALDYNTGIVISNISDTAGSCMATYSGRGAPADAVDIGEIMPGMQEVFLVSSHAEDFSGYLKVSCGLEAAAGFAHVVDSTGLAGSQGYIAQCSAGTCN